MFELQKSDLRSRVIERIQLQPDPERPLLPRHVKGGVDRHLEVVGPDTLADVTHRQGEKTVEIYQGNEIVRESFFRTGTPDASRWTLNPRPTSLWDVFVKESVVFIASESQS